MDLLLLVDGSSYLYRAFHALPDLRNKAGEPTGAIYGMVSMLRRLRQDVSAQYSAVIFDAPGKTFRDDWYPDYKATRSAMPDDLVRQIVPIHAVVAALGWPILMIDGIEADDVIGTLAKRATANGLRTLVSTGDKDLAQLVDGHVTLINTMNRVPTPGPASGWHGAGEVLDIEGVEAKFGVAPDRIVDYLTLVGDTVDNVPGVDKVGPKTAAKWLAQYGSLDEVVAHAADIKGAVGENLRRALDWLPMGRKLVTVKTDCPLDEVPDISTTLVPKDEDRNALLELFDRYGFKTWLKEVAQEDAAVDAAGETGAERASGVVDETLPAVKPGADIERIYETIITPESLDAWIARIAAAELTAFDTETTSLDPLRAKLVGMSFSIEPGHAGYLPLAHRSMDATAPQQLPFDETLAKLRPWLEDAAKKKVGQNLKYDTHVLANHGIALRGVEHDTLLQSYVYESHRNHGLEDLARRHLGVEDLVSYEDICGKGAKQIGFDEVAIDVATKYGAEDADLTLRVHRALYPSIARSPSLDSVYRTIEMPTSAVLQKVERNGVLIDADLLNRQGAELGAKMAELETKAFELAGQPFNLGSPKQIGELLFDKLKLPVARRTASGAPSTDEDVLAKLANDYPLPKVLLDHRALSKLKSTYTDKLPKMVNPATGRVHTNYAQAVAVTGRLASNDPNLQNIPVRTAEGRRIREAFIAPTGSTIVSSDYSQIELRIMAHISGDEALIDAFAKNEDVHRRTAAEVFNTTPDEVTSEQRRYAKVINFGLIYGMGVFGLASNLGIERDAAKLYIDRYFMRYPGVAAYMQETRESAKAKGYVETVFGRRLWLSEINSPNGPRRAGAERAAINAPMQGTAADLIKLSMIAVQDWLERDGLATRMVMQVHDELVLEVPDAELAIVREQVPKLMASVADLKVPLDVELGAGPNWDEAH
ncbi:MAG: DNA polymerase I [Burkholderiaceae bacterium]